MALMTFDQIPLPGMVRCKLTKHGRVANPVMLTELRTNGAEGRCKADAVPTVGSWFEMIASTPNPEATARWVSTSVIQKVEEVGPNHWRFETLNSVYELEKFDG